MTDPSQLPPDAAAMAEEVAPFSERLNAYVRIFGIGLAAAGVVGLVIGLLSQYTVASSIAYTLLVVGVLQLLWGGASGGGYINLGFGVVDRLTEGRGNDEPPTPAAEERARERTSPKYGIRSDRKPKDPMERLRKGLRPEANPPAFWSVISGFLYIGIAVLLFSL